MLTLNLTNRLPEAEVDALVGKFLDAGHYDRVLTEDADVYKPDGSLLLKFRKRVIPNGLCKAAWQNLREAATETGNRGLAAGEVEFDGSVGRLGAYNVLVEESKTRFRRLLKDGSVSRTSEARPVQSGVVGYYDRYPRIPYCRLTAYSMEHPDRFKAAMPLFQSINAVFAREVPDRYAAQQEYIQRTHPDFYIHGTVFTTVTVNRNWRTAVHRDAGDLKAGFGVLTALEAGKYQGCYLVFPAFRVAVDMRTSDVLLCDVHEYHGNSSLNGRPGAYERISLVLYYREAMHKCGSAHEEGERAKRRQLGQPMYES